MAHSSPGEQVHPAAPAAVCLALAEALATRICHDLAGGLGTLIGALEMAGEDAGFAGEATSVAQDAATTLGNRLRFMRVAWGGGGEPIDAAAISELAAGLPCGRRVRVQLDALAPDRMFAADAARLLVNLLLVGVEGLAGEGSVEVAEAGGGDVMIVIQGPRAAWPAGFAAQFTDANLALHAASGGGPRLLQAPLTALIAHASGRRLSMLLGARTEGAAPLIADLG